MSPKEQVAVTEPADNSIETIQQQLSVEATKHRNRERSRMIAYPLGTAILLVLIWQFLISGLGVKSYLVPTPVDVAQAIGTYSGELFANTWVTVEETVIGFGLSIVVGIPLGLGIAMSPLFSRSIYPLLVGSNALPKVAVAPLFIVWFGFGTLPKILIAFLVAFFPIVINTIVGLGGIDTEKVYLARSLRLSAITTFFKIRLPEALPTIFGGIKVASTLAVIGAVVGEFVGTDQGLGKVLLDSNANLQTALLFAVLVFLTVFSMLLFGAVVVAERLIIPWHSAIQSSK